LHSSWLPNLKKKKPFSLEKMSREQVGF